MSKILTWEQAKKIADVLHKQNMTLVSTNGCFDLLHKGHVSYLQKARDLGDFLIVAINADESVKKLKGPTRPINSASDRAHVVSALACVDAVCIFEQETPVEFLNIIQPNVHVKGGDYNPEEIPENAALKKWGGSIKIIPFVEGYSTTSIIKRMNS